MRDTTDDVEANDVTFGTDPRSGGSRGARRINGCEAAISKQEPMVNPGGSVPADKVARGVKSQREAKRGALRIDGGELPFAE